MKTALFIIGGTVLGALLGVIVLFIQICCAVAHDEFEEVEQDSEDEK